MKTREELKESFMEICMGESYLNETLSTAIVDKCLNDVDKYANQVKPRWISVEDELPKSTGNYIVCESNGSVSEMYYRNDAKIFLWRNFEQTGKITHWMPLPEKPEL